MEKTNNLLFEGALVVVSIFLALALESAWSNYQEHATNIYGMPFSFTW